MALLKILKKDKIAATLAPDGWYPVTVSDITSSASKSGKSNSTYVHLIVNGGPMEQKEFTVVFNDGVNSNSILNGMQYMPVGKFMDFHAAVMGAPIDSDGDTDIDTDTYIGRSLDVKVYQEAVEGTPTNGIQGFAPVGVGSGSKTIF